MRFELAIAWRYFLSGRSQTLLTVSGVTVGVTVLIFISALVGGVERTMIARILGTVAPVVVLPPRPLPRVLGPPSGQLSAHSSPLSVKAGRASTESGERRAESRSEATR
jgi:lipoprotein-releasing system permease protein